MPQLFTSKERVFSFKLFKRYIGCFLLHVRADHDGGKQFLRGMRKILRVREVMEREPRISF